MAMAQQVGLKIFQYRKYLGLTQEELANKVGVESASYISKIEHGHSSPSFELLERMFRIFDVSPQDFFNFEIAGSENAATSKFEKWMMRYRAILKGKSDADLKRGYVILKKALM